MSLTCYSFIHSYSMSLKKKSATTHSNLSQWRKKKNIEAQKELIYTIRILKMPKNVFLFPIFQIEIYIEEPLHCHLLLSIIGHWVFYVFRLYFMCLSKWEAWNQIIIIRVYFNKFEIKCNRSCRFIRKCLHIKSAISFMLNMFIIKSNNVLKRHEKKNWHTHYTVRLEISCDPFWLLQS